MCGAPHQGNEAPPTDTPTTLSLCQAGLEENRKREDELASFQRSHQQACSASQQRSVEIVTAFESKVSCHVTLM